MQTTTMAGAEAEQAQSLDPLAEAFRTMGRIENAAGIDPAISLASIAISLKRIAFTLEQINGGVGYEGQRRHEDIAKLADVLERTRDRLREKYGPVGPPGTAGNW